MQSPSAGKHIQTFSFAFMTDYKLVLLPTWPSSFAMLSALSSRAVTSPSWGCDAQDQLSGPEL